MSEQLKICSKCGRELPLSCYHKNGFDNNGKQKWRGYCKDCANAREKQRYQEKKEFVNSQKVRCAKCGDDRSYVLDFHHKDKNSKDFTIGQFKRGNFTVLQSEIDKCVVLCANCHREFHHLETENNIDIDTYLHSAI